MRPAAEMLAETLEPPPEAMERPRRAFPHKLCALALALLTYAALVRHGGPGYFCRTIPQAPAAVAVAR